jgi:hypothetical protein
MRTQIFISVCVILSGCAADPSSYVSCTGPYDPDPQAVTRRVMAAHGNLAAASVLKCLSVEGSGFDDDPDEEACLVVFDARANEPALTAFYSSRPIGALPAVVAQLAGDASPIRARGLWLQPSKVEPLLYEMRASQTAILYKRHVRCLDLREVV